MERGLQNPLSLQFRQPVRLNSGPSDLFCEKSKPCFYLLIVAPEAFSSEPGEGTRHLRRLTFDMSGKQRRAHCCRSGTKAPAVVCPLDGGVRSLAAHGPHFARLHRHQRSQTEPALAHAGSIYALRVAPPLANPHSAERYWQVLAFPRCANRTAADALHRGHNPRTNDHARTLARRCACCWTNGPQGQAHKTTKTALRRDARQRCRCTHRRSQHALTTRRVAQALVHV
jgi:hypothetical protein